MPQLRQPLDAASLAERRRQRWEPDGSRDWTPDECRTSSEEREVHRQLEDQGYEFYGEQGNGKNDEARNELLTLENYHRNEGVLEGKSDESE